MNKLKEFLAKLLEKGFATAEEKAIVKELVDALQDEEKTAVADEVAEVEALSEKSDDEALDEETVKGLVSGEIQKSVKDQLEKMSNELVAKFLKGVKENRSKAVTKTVAKEKFSESKDFFSKLFSGQNEVLKASGYLDTATAGTAGYLVPPAEFIAEVYRIADTGYGVARANMRYIPKNGAGNQITIPALGTSVSAFWTAQAGVKTSTEPSFNLPTITLQKLAAIVPWTDEFAEDVGVNVVQLLAELFAESLAIQEDLAFFTGDGSGAFGGFTGILNNGSVNSVAITSASIQDLTADDLLDMQDQTPAGALNGASYFMHRSILSIVRKLKDDNNNYIYQNPGAGQPSTVWNYPVIIAEALPAVGDDAEDTPFIIFGNLKNTCIISDKGTLAVKLFDSGSVRNVGDTTDLNLLTQDMTAMRVVRRVGFVIAMPTGITVLSTGVTGS